MNKRRNRLKRFWKNENISYQENDFMEIDYGYIFRSSTKPVQKVSKIENIEDFRRNMKRC